MTHSRTSCGALDQTKRHPRWCRSRPRLAYWTLLWCSAAAFCGAAMDRPVLAAEHGVIGFTEPVKTVELAACESGRLARIDVLPGDQVTAGFVVGALESEVLKANRTFAVAKHASQAKVNAARIRAERARENYTKLEQLNREGHGGAR
ncbi:MAG: hypothetical protein ACK5Q5_03910, partial [Planctomycetaceae bacterium]